MRSSLVGADFMSARWTLYNVVGGHEVHPYKENVISQIVSVKATFPTY